MKRILLIGMVIVFAWTIAVKAQDSPAPARGGRGAAGRGAAATRQPPIGMPGMGFGGRMSVADAEKSLPKVEVPPLVFPKRQLKFEVLETETPMDARSIEELNDHYLAELTLRGPRQPDLFTGVSPASPEWVYGNQVWSPWRVFTYAFEYGERGGLQEEILKSLAKDHQPAEEIAKWFGKRRYQVWGSGDAAAQLNYRVRIAAPTVDRAKELVEALLTIYDNGVFAPLLQTDEKLKRQHQILLEEDRRALADAEQAAADREKEFDQLKDYEDLSSEVLTSLTTQLWQIAVDKAGVDARIKACDKLRGDAEVEKLRTAAQIELTGLQAREAAVKDIVAKGRKRRELGSALSRAQSTAKNLKEQRIPREEEAVAFYEDQLKRYQPFPVVDDKVTIRPIKWQLVKPKE